HGGLNQTETHRPIFGRPLQFRVEFLHIRSHRARRLPTGPVSVHRLFEERGIVYLNKSISRETLISLTLDPCVPSDFSSCFPAPRSFSARQPELKISPEPSGLRPTRRARASPIGMRREITNPCGAVNTSEVWPNSFNPSMRTASLPNFSA